MTRTPSGIKINKVRPQNTTQVYNRQGRARTIYVRLLHLSYMGNELEQSGSKLVLSKEICVSAMSSISATSTTSGQLSEFHGGRILPNQFKGSVTRDFRLQVFFLNQCPPGL
jgi:hypothetical protein